LVTRTALTTLNEPVHHEDAARLDTLRLTVKMIVEVDLRAVVEMLVERIVSSLESARD
jgi:hypothetical protein